MKLKTMCGLILMLTGFSISVVRKAVTGSVIGSVKSDLFGIIGIILIILGLLITIINPQLLKKIHS